MDRFSAQSSNTSLQSINSILSDEANTSFLSYSSTLAAVKNNSRSHHFSNSDNPTKTESGNDAEDEFSTLSTDGDTKGNDEKDDKEALLGRAASQSLSDILDHVRPPKILPPPSPSHLQLPRDVHAHGSRESLKSLTESLAVDNRGTVDPASSSQLKLPSGAVLQKHVDISRLNVERQQKVCIIINDIDQYIL